MQSDMQEDVMDNDVVRYCGSMHVDCCLGTKEHDKR